MWPTLCLLLLGVASTQAVTCYLHAARTDASAFDPSVTCKDSYCYTMHQYENANPKDQHYVVRGCMTTCSMGALNSGGGIVVPDTYVAGSGTTTTIACCNDQDNCNSATGVSTNLVLLAAALIAVVRLHD